ncbi:MAG: ABC transporter permease [Gemmatimonadetes bacterium]|nr:ABC transporter permease [Gemmatimonadota bacterium]
MSEKSSGGRRSRLFQKEPGTEVGDELAFHLEERVREYVARGMDPEAARAAALERFGNLEGVREECAQMLHEERRAEARRDWLDDLRQDLRFGVRSALRAPVFSLLAVLTLALGIGANAAVFGVVKSVLLNALPYRDSGALVRVYGRFRDGTNEQGGLSAGTITDVAERQHSFSSMAAFRSNPTDAVLAGTDEPRVVQVAWVQPAFFPTLGVSAAMGRLIRDDDVADTARMVLLTHPAWQRLFGGDPGIVGREVVTNGITRTVVGVLPRGFVGPMGDADIYYPLNLGPTLRDPVAVRGAGWLGMVARLKPGVAQDAARREMEVIADQLSREYPRDDGSLGIRAMPIRDAMVGDTRTPLLVLMASAGLVLLITCANLAGALLSRTLSRRKEFAVRVALGAGRGRLVRQLLTESLLLAVAGGVAGILLAMGGLALLRGLATQALPSYAELSLDRGALLFTSVLALLTGVVFGLAPALSVRRSEPQETLRDETRGASEGRRSRNLRGVLVAGQIALCVSLLTGAGLLVRSLLAMTSQAPGFGPDGVLAVAVQLPSATYQDPAAQTRFFGLLEERLRGLPGVTSVGEASAVPTDVKQHNGINIVGAPPPSSDAQPFVLYAPVSDDYFHTLRIPLRSGRVFGPQDRPDAPPTMVVSEAMARRFWPGGGALGAQLRMGPDPNSTPYTVVGIVGDVRNDPARPDAEPMAYGTSRLDARPTRTLLLRTSGDPLALVNPVRREIAAVDPGVPMREATTLRTFLADRLTSRRLPVVLMTAFGALALLLASVGVYAMFASMAAAREREFGVRVALGSSRRAIASLVLRQGGVWMAAGLVAGAGGIVLVTRFVRGLLYGVEPFDPVALGAALALLLACAAVALLVPVRRATRVDPVTILR